MQADKLQDTLRGDVYRGLLLAERRDAAAVEDIRRELRRRSEALATMIAANQSLPRSTPLPGRPIAS